MAISKDAIPGDPPAAKAQWTLDKLLKGAGPDADPTEIDVPTGVTIVRKTANQTVNNSTTLVNDDHLLLALAANEVWYVKLILLQTSSATADIKYQFTVPTDGALYGMTTYCNASDTWTSGYTVAASILSISGGMAAIPNRLVTEFIVKNGANAGNLQLQWAQNTADASDTIVKANSSLICHKLA